MGLQPIFNENRIASVIAPLTLGVSRHMNVSFISNECVKNGVYLKKIVKIAMFLQAHLQCRKADSYLENAKFEEAVACHEKAIG